MPRDPLYVGCAVLVFLVLVILVLKLLNAV